MNYMLNTTIYEYKSEMKIQSYKYKVRLNIKLWIQKKYSLHLKYKVTLKGKIQTNRSWTICWIQQYMNTKVRWKYKVINTKWDWI